MPTTKQLMIVYANSQPTRLLFRDQLKREQNQEQGEEKEGTPLNIILYDCSQTDKYPCQVVCKQSQFRF